MFMRTSTSRIGVYEHVENTFIDVRITLRATADYYPFTHQDSLLYKEKVLDVICCYAISQL